MGIVIPIPIVNQEHPSLLHLRLLLDCGEIQSSSSFWFGGIMTTSMTQYTAACYKRVDGSVKQVPGCGVGGTGDILGADYFYATVSMGVSTMALLSLMDK